MHQAEWKYAATSTYAPAVAVAVVAVSVEAGRPENSSRHSLVSRGQGKRVAVPPESGTAAPALVPSERVVRAGGAGAQAGPRRAVEMTAVGLDWAKVPAWQSD